MSTRTVYQVHCPGVRSRFIYPGYFLCTKKKLVPVLKPTLEQFQLIEVGITLNYNFFLAQCTSVFLFNTQKCTDLERKVLHGEIIVQL